LENILKVMIAVVFARRGFVVSSSGTRRECVCCLSECVLEVMMESVMRKKEREERKGREEDSYS